MIKLEGSINQNNFLASRKKSAYNLIWLTVFAIAMGFLETTVVVYLREILYPNGFSFPLAP